MGGEDGKLRDMMGSTALDVFNLHGGETETYIVTQSKKLHARKTPNSPVTSIRDFELMEKKEQSLPYTKRKQSRER
jgi:hypothetical protein